MKQIRFKSLFINNDFCIISKGYRLYKYFPEKNQIIKYANIKDNYYSFLSSFFLTRRFFRAEITNYYRLENGIEICIAKKGIFRKDIDSYEFIKCFSVPKGSRPMNLCIDNNNYLYFGEYFSNMNKKSVDIYCSKDSGKTWEVVYTFLEGNINHIHGLFYDKFTNRIWVATGDRENECIIGYTENCFKTFNELFRGNQEYRTTNLFFFEKYIIYATDSQYIQNEVKIIDRQTLSIETLQNIQGSCIYGIQLQNNLVISTTVEPSKVNNDKHSYVWISKDGKSWKMIFKGIKDNYNGYLFQFGSFTFPNYDKSYDKLHITFNGRALKKYDGKSITINI